MALVNQLDAIEAQEIESNPTIFTRRYKMPTSIPYDPSLVLGNIIFQEKLEAVKAVADAQKPINDAEENLNLLITAKRSLDMTIQELMTLGVDQTEIDRVISEGDKLAKEIGETAIDLSQKRVAAYSTNGTVTAARKALLGIVNFDTESPIDYNRTQYKNFPISADSIKMDAQYFSLDESKQAAKNHVSNIQGYISASTQFLGSSRSAEITGAAQQQVSSQVSNHRLSGTLVITAGCTHKNALVLAPFILDFDKAIRVWNSIYKDDQIKLDKPKNLAEIAQAEAKDEEKKLNILSGATFGSSFVGMVHVLRTEETISSQQMYSAAATLQAQMKTGGWFANAEGGFGVSSSFANDVKSMLSTQQINSHVSLVVMGAVPTIKSNQVQIGVKQFADFDPKQMMDKLATLANATEQGRESVSASSNAARSGNQMMQIRGAEIKSVMSGLDNIDDGKNQMLDINSLMTAFEDFVNKAVAGNIGVPINYYVKPITKAQLAQGWVSKYYPEYLQIKADDSEPEKTG